MAGPVIVIGGGFTGALLAINLLRHDGPPAILVERAARPARGVAYATHDPDHLLNVRAANMSALPDRPDHFTQWLARRPGAPSGGFVSRGLYGSYLADLLEEAVARAGHRLSVIRGEAIDCAMPGDGGAIVMLADGRRLVADTVALAPGNLPPLVPPGLDVSALPAGCYVENPWRGTIDEGLGREDVVLVLGTGLTMIDVALALDARGFAGRIVAISRRGLLPRPHAEGGPAVGTLAERPEPTPLALLRAVRARSDGIGWRAAVDELRPLTQGIWRAMAIPEQRRFLRHLRPWWDVHRHRIAPEVAERIARMRHEGRLDIVSGQLIGCEAERRRAHVRYRARGNGAEHGIVAARIINGTGPQGDLTRATDPLLRALAARGLIRPDPLNIGVDVDQDSRAIGADGSASDRLLMLGPMTRGAFWEIVAVPDIRRQVWSVARRLSSAQWVEGEGL